MKHVSESRRLQFPASQRDAATRFHRMTGDDALRKRFTAFRSAVLELATLLMLANLTVASGLLIEYLDALARYPVASFANTF